MTRRVTVLSDSGVHRTTAGYSLERVVRVDGAATSAKIRLEVHRYTYSPHSSFTAALWTPTGWTEVARVHGESPMAMGMPGGGGSAWFAKLEVRQACEQAAEMMADWLLERAIEVVEP